jgi:hypothetical protein
MELRPREGELLEIELLSGGLNSVGSRGEK